MDQKFSLADLRQFTGTDTWYRHALNPGVTYTEGAQFLAENAGAYWLLDEIAINNLYDKRLKAEEFQVWKLEVKDDAAMLYVEDGNDVKVFEKQISFTDFPAPGVTLWFTGNVIMLPSEY